MKKHQIYITIFILLLLTACGGSRNNTKREDGDLSGNISLSGAFALYPLVVKWADNFKQLHPHVRIDISAGGAGKGITDALAQVVDLGMVSRDLVEDEIHKGAWGIAVAKDAVVPTINANNPILKDLLSHGLTQETATGLWVEGTIRTWGEVVGITNSTPITVYTRSDACGAAETWAKWLGKNQEDLLGTGVYGDPGIASAIQKDINGIGLNNIGYVYDEKTRRPYPGLVVLPIDVNGNGKIDEDEQYYETKDKIIQAIAENKYPSPPARELFLVSKGKPTDPIVKAFLIYILTEGQAANIQQGYIPINPEKIKKQLEWLNDEQ